MGVANILSEQPAVVIANPEYISHRIDPNPFKPEYIYSDLRLDEYRSLDGDVLDLQVLLKNGKEGLSGGATPLGANYKSKGIRFIRTSEVNDCWIDCDSCVFISLEDDQSIRRSRLKKGDVLLTITGACFGKSAEVTTKLLPANISQHSVRLRMKESLIPSYLVAYLNSKTGQMQILKQTVGSTRQAIDYIGINKIRIPVPERLIQDYIGSNVILAEKCREEANMLRREINKTIDKRLKQLGILYVQNDKEDQIAFSAKLRDLTHIRLDAKYYRPRYISLEKNITSVKHDYLESMISDCNYGASVPSVYVVQGIPFIRGVDLIENRILSGGMCYLNSALSNKVKRSRVKENDILITRSCSVGITSVVTDKCDGHAFGSYMIRFSINSNYNPFYVAAFLNSPYGKAQIERLKNGAVQENINLEEIGRIVIPCIPKNDQDEIETIVRSWIDLSDKSTNLISKAKTNIESLLEGKLDTDAILSGKLKAPTWEDIEKELEGI